MAFAGDDIGDRKGQELAWTEWSQRQASDGFQHKGTLGPAFILEAAHAYPEWSPARPCWRNCNGSRLYDACRIKFAIGTATLPHRPEYSHKNLDCDNGADQAQQARRCHRTARWFADVIGSDHRRLVETLFSPAIDYQQPCTGKLTAS
jgi:hypothetical protein